MPQGHPPTTQTNIQIQLTNNILCILRNKVVTKLTAKPEPSCITNYTQFAEVQDVLSPFKKKKKQIPTPQPSTTYLTKYLGECESELRSNERYSSSSENKSWKKCRPVWDLNPRALRYQCSARPAELTVIGSNPVQTWIFCLNSAHYGEDLFLYSLLYTQFIYMIFKYSQSFEVFTFTLSVSLFLIFLLFFGFLNLTFQVEMESIS